MFTGSDVVALRQKTGAGILDCKKALTETDGDMDKAVDYLREKGIATAAKKAGRIAAEGVCYAEGKYRSARGSQLRIRFRLQGRDVPGIRQGSGGLYL